MKSRVQIKHDSGILYVGIDVSKDKLAVYAGDLFEEEIDNTRRAIARMVKTIGRGVDRPIRFVLEETGCYSLPVHLELDRLGQQVCVVNPSRVRHYAIGCGVMAKTDRIDARIIRRFAEANDCEPTPIPSETRMLLRELIRTRGLLVKIRTMIQTLRKMTVSPSSRTLLGEVDRFLRTKIDKLEAEIVRHGKEDEEIERVSRKLDELPGVAALTATTIATLAPELGTLGKRRAASLIGLAPFVHDSGKYKGQRRIGGGRWDLRHALYMPVLTAVQKDATLRAFYRHLVDDRGKRKKIALAAAMRKMFIHMDRLIAGLNGKEEAMPT